ncbi:MAG TPA: cellulase family glycosylhydrolase, partial [Polyangiaceae bacterium]
LVDAIRETGSNHLLLLGGVQFSNALTQWLSHRPDDPAGNIGAAWHVYNNNACRNATCWNGVPAEVVAAVPVVATEIGQNDCTGDSFLLPLMQFLDDHETGYLAWSWNAGGSCEPVVPGTSEGHPWFLITDYATGEPNSDYAKTFRDHLADVVQ